MTKVLGFWGRKNLAALCGWTPCAGPATGLRLAREAVKLVGLLVSIHQILEFESLIENRPANQFLIVKFRI
jgi:hypothetical protein